QQAFQKWTAANNTNGSGVGFLPANSGHPAMLTVQAGAFQKNGVSSAAGTTITAVNGEVTSATTNIDIFNFGGNFFDSSQDNFLPWMLKLMLHEIGHTMGLNDVDVPNPNANCGGQTAGNSVMNGKCGINDEGGNMPKDVKNCDNQTVTSNTEYAQGG